MNRQNRPSRADNTAEYARRRAAYERQKAREAEEARRREIEKQRRAARRRHSLRVFGGRFLVGVVIFLLLAAVAGVLFWIHFNRTHPAEEPRVVRYTYGETAGASLTEASARQGGVLYTDFHELAAWLGMTVVGDADRIRFVAVPETNAGTTDSAGSGREESVTFYPASDRATVNGQDVRLAAPAVLLGEHILVPAGFVSEYMCGVTAAVTDGAVAYARTEGEPLAFRLKDVRPLETIPEDDYSALGGTTGQTDPPTPPAPVTTGGEAPAIAEPAMPAVTFTADLSAYEEFMNPADRDGYLLLVNNTSTLDASYLPDDLTDLADTRKDGRATQKMRRTAAKALEAMFIEMRACGYTDVSVTSAYRSYEYQNTLFNMYTANEMAANPSLTLSQAQAITATYSARPGTSEHQSGLCCDMHNLPSADRAFAQKDAYKWLCDNAWKFGFILRFPEGKEDITQISFEPWHYRYVGRAHAYAIHESGLCLEEYLAQR